MSNGKTPDRPHVVWVYYQPLTKALSVTTWLETSHELALTGWRVTLVAPRTGNGRSDPTPVHAGGSSAQIVSVPRLDVFFLRQVSFHIGVILLLLKQWRTVDMILFHVMSAVWIVPLRLVRTFTRRRTPLVVMDTRTLKMSPPDKDRLKDKVRSTMLDLAGRLAFRWADGHVVITPHIAEVLPIPRDRIWGWWPSGVNLERFAPAIRTRTWPGRDQPIRLVYAGELAYERNLLTLSQAVEEANAAGMAFSLDLVGDGAQRTELEDFAQQTDGRIRVVGRVPYSQMPEILARSHVGILPFPDEQKFRVSSPIKLFEYMAAGLPILATRIVCHTDVVGEGGYVFWAEDGSRQALLAALRNTWQGQTALEEMGQRAAADAPAWTWAASAKKLKAALECGRTIGGSRGPGKRNRGEETRAYDRQR
jgi:glycosyltransferase involved in cell wall biosynthesis